MAYPLFAVHEGQGVMGNLLKLLSREGDEGDKIDLFLDFESKFLLVLFLLDVLYFQYFSTFPIQILISEI